MRRENGLLIFENVDEEKIETKLGFKGILVRIHPDNHAYGEILEINEGRERPIGIIDIIYYYPFVPSAKEAGKLFKNKVQSIILGNYPVALEMGVPEIVISADLAYELFFDYNVWYYLNKNLIMCKFNWFYELKTRS